MSSRHALAATAIFVLAAAIAPGGQATANLIDTNTLFAECRDGDDPKATDSTYKAGTCLGYVLGVADALIPAGLYCVPEMVTAGQVLDVAKLYIRDHPELRKVEAPRLIVEALKERFPCN